VGTGGESWSEQEVGDYADFCLSSPARFLCCESIWIFVYRLRALFDFMGFSAIVLACQNNQKLVWKIGESD